jgi:hypothetical protein
MPPYTGAKYNKRTLTAEELSDRKERQLAAARRWRAKNKDKMRTYHLEYAQRKKDAPKTSIVTKENKNIPPAAPTLDSWQKS